MEQDCGCTLNFSTGPGGIPYDLTLDYCPMHKAAEAMLAALEKCRARLGVLDDRQGIRSQAVLDEAITAIAQARGGIDK